MNNDCQYIEIQYAINWKARFSFGFSNGCKKKDFANKLQRKKKIKNTRNLKLLCKQEKQFKQSTLMYFWSGISIRFKDRRKNNAC